MVIAFSSSVGSDTIISLFFFEHDENKKSDKNKINKYLNILDKV